MHRGFRLLCVGVTLVLVSCGGGGSDSSPQSVNQNPPATAVVTGTIIGSRDRGPLADVSVAIVPAGAVRPAASGVTSGAGIYRVANVPRGRGSIVVTGVPENCEAPNPVDYTVVDAMATLTVDINVRCVPALLVVEPSDASSLLLFATDGNGHEKISVFGSRDAFGRPTAVERIGYLSATGVATVLELGPDGLPNRLEDAAGNGLAFGSYTNNSVEITPFDASGNQLALPVTVSLHAERLAELRRIVSEINGSGIASSGTSNAAKQFSALQDLDPANVVRSHVLTHINFANAARLSGYAYGIFDCTKIILLPVSALNPFTALGCGGVLIRLLMDVGVIQTPGWVESITIIEPLGGCVAEDNFIERLEECFQLVLEVGALLEDIIYIDASAPTVSRFTSTRTKCLS